MIYSALINRVLKFVYDAHDGQMDKSGVPYVFHPFTVASSMTDENSTLLGLLHDVIEDTSVTYDEVKALGVPNEVMDALKLLTHDKDTPYLDYIRRMKGNALACKVKLADLAHNSDVSRGGIDEETPERLKKYATARRIILGEEQ